MRRSWHHTQKTADHGRPKDTISISERPPSVEDRAVPGHWEGDLLFGDRDSRIAMLVERKTCYVMLVKVDGKDAETVVNALIKRSRRLPRELYRSLLGIAVNSWRRIAALRWPPKSKSTSAPPPRAIPTNLCVDRLNQGQERTAPHRDSPRRRPQKASQAHNCPTPARHQKLQPSRQL